MMEMDLLEHRISEDRPPADRMLRKLDDKRLELAVLMRECKERNAMAEG